MVAAGGAPATQVLIGIVEPHFGREDEAVTHLEQAAEGLRAVRDRWGLTLALNMLKDNRLLCVYRLNSGVPFGESFSSRV